MQQTEYILTKSTYVKGLQCIRSLYLNKHCKHLSTPFSKERLASFERGRMFEKKFKAQFRSAVDIDEKLGNKIHQYPVFTENLLDKNKEITLFEAGFIHNDVLVLTDVLKKNIDDSYTIYEVKNSTELKDVHISDLSVQYFVCKNKLGNIRDFNLVINDNENFKIINLTQQLQNNIPFVKENISKFKNILAQSEAPIIEMGNHCDLPYECEFREYCGKNATKKEVKPLEKVIESGKTGELTWCITDDGTLTISGKGDMPHNGEVEQTWKKYRDFFTNVIVENGVTSIGSNAFNCCSSLTSITIPNSVNSIGYWAFGDCSSLESINVDDNNLKYSSKNGVLFNKIKTILIKFPSFKIDLKYTIPNSVESIGDWAFSGCSNLTSITIPNSVETIGNSAFSLCRNLESIFIPDSVNFIRNCAFTHCISLKSITIPDSVKSIGYYAFCLCSSLTTITIPDSVNSIGEEAFHGCSSLEFITIPDSVDSIGSRAFSGCSNLTEIINHSKTPQNIIRYLFKSDSFEGLDKSKCTLRVPAEAMSAYRATEGWKDFKNIEPLLEKQDNKMKYEISLKNPFILDDGTELDKDNTLFFNAAKLVLETERRIIYLTGKAGTGKTTFLKYIRSVFQGNMVVLAPTGVAAINARGQTIHSFFQIKPSIYVPDDKRLRKRAANNDIDKSTIFDYFKYNPERLKIIKELELLIIDEISMVRCDLLDVVDRLLRVFRNREFEPFGGVQIILIGDTFQLPPVAPSDEWNILKQFYSSHFFFSSKVIQNNKPIYIELKKIYRQKEVEFIDLLNRVRVNQIEENELDMLNSRYKPSFIPDNNSNYITLSTHNKTAEILNLTKLDELKTELKVFEATVSGTFIDKNMPTDRVLQLKEGAQIMFVKNDSEKQYYNGTIAKIIKIEGNNIMVQTEYDQEITVKKETWDNVVYTWNVEHKKIEEEVIGRFTQFPVKLAWAITVHKSQGKTFEKVIADLGNAFDHGQVYVALSRCTKLSGLVLKSRITRDVIKTDNRALEFARTETPENIIIQEFEKGKADKLYRMCSDAFDNNLFDEMFKNLNDAIKIRDDRETPKFIQYIRVKLKLFHRYKGYISESFKKSEEYENIIKEKELLCDNHIEKIAELKREIEKLEKNYRKLEYDNNNLTNLISLLNRDLENKDIIINSLNDKIKLTEILLNQKINSIKQELSNTQTELIRVNTITWWQKMIGKK